MSVRFAKTLEAHWKYRGFSKSQEGRRISQVSEIMVLNWAFLDHAFRVLRGRLPR
jgi:hypothetical protein